MKIEVITPLDLEDFVKRIENLEEDSKLHDSLLHDVYENIDQMKKRLDGLEKQIKSLESDKEPYSKKMIGIDDIIGLEEIEPFEEKFKEVVRFFYQNGWISRRECEEILELLRNG